MGLKRCKICLQIDCRCPKFKIKKPFDPSKLKEEEERGEAAKKGHAKRAINRKKTFRK